MLSHITGAKSLRYGNGLRLRKAPSLTARLWISTATRSLLTTEKRSRLRRYGARGARSPIEGATDPSSHYVGLDRDLTFQGDCSAHRKRANNHLPHVQRPHHRLPHKPPVSLSGLP